MLFKHDIEVKYSVFGKIIFSKNVISDLYIMFKHDLDQNYDFKKLLGALVNPLSAKNVYTRFDP